MPLNQDNDHCQDQSDERRDGHRDERYEVLDRQQDREPRDATLTAWLQRRESVARGSSVLSEHLHITAEEAEVLLLSEACRRHVLIAGLAAQTRQRPGVARSWSAAGCPVCARPARLRVYGHYEMVRVLVCPGGHGVICRP